jgi:hypothetical protein
MEQRPEPSNFGLHVFSGQPHGGHRVATTGRAAHAAAKCDRPNDY